MNKKDLVIATSRELFTKYGYKKVTMDEIAASSGVTKKTIYSYFKDKESMFEYFIQEELENMKSEIESLKAKKMPFIDFVSLSVYKMLSYKKNSELITNIVKEFPIEKNNSFSKIYDEEIIKYIDNNLKKAITQNNIKECDTHLTAFIIYKVYISLLFEYDRDIDEQEVTNKITTILKNGLLK